MPFEQQSRSWFAIAYRYVHEDRLGGLEPRRTRIRRWYRGLHADRRRDGPATGKSRDSEKTQLGKCATRKRGECSAQLCCSRWCNPPSGEAGI